MGEAILVPSGWTKLALLGSTPTSLILYAWGYIVAQRDLLEHCAIVSLSQPLPVDCHGHSWESVKKALSLGSKSLLTD